MKGTLYKNIILTLLITTLALTADAGDRWQSGFDTADSAVDGIDSVLSLEAVLSLVAAQNPSLRSFAFMRKAALGRLKQAGLWRNPEFASEFEEVGWDAPGLSESEITISLSQEFEVFGQRHARKQVALSGLSSTEFEIKLAAFDLYLDTKSRFYKLIYFQRGAALADSSVNLARNIVETIKYRMKQGAALQSVLLLAQLEFQRASLIGKEAQQELQSARINLAALWNSESADITVHAEEEPDLRAATEKLPSLNLLLDSTRNVRQLHYRKQMTRAERKFASVEAKPGITLSGGYKRLEATNSNSLLFGISLPLPLLNRNQGRTASLDAKLRSLEYDQERTRLETRAFIKATSLRLNQLISQHITLDTLLLPTALNAYETLQQIYNVGRIPYTTLLEAQRALIELRFTHNNVIFAVYEQLIAIERISGVRIYK